MRRFNLSLATVLLLGLSAQSAAGRDVFRSRVVPNAPPDAVSRAPG